MRRFSLLVFTIIFALNSVLFVDASAAAPLSERQIEIIRANCEAAQRTLQQLQQSDVATRLSRGRDYEQLLKLMAIFNSRVVLNKLEASTLTNVTEEFETEFRAFQEQYVTYSEQLSATISMRCEQQPVTFYDELNVAREDRMQLAEQVAAMDELLDQYRQALNQLSTSLDEQKEEAA